jgi:hypothetical protein
MGNESVNEQQQTQLAMFITEVRENFKAAGKVEPPASSWFSRLIQKIFG